MNYFSINIKQNQISIERNSKNFGINSPKIIQTNAKRKYSDKSYFKSFSKYILRKEDELHQDDENFKYKILFNKLIQGKKDELNNDVEYIKVLLFSKNDIRSIKFRDNFLKELRNSIFSFIDKIHNLTFN